MRGNARGDEHEQLIFSARLIRNCWAGVDLDLVCLGTSHLLAV